MSARGYGVSVEDGRVSKIEYASSEEIAKGQANIIDGNSNVVATVDLGRLAAGSIGEVKWDGTYSNGSVAADGVYTVAIVAWNANGDRITDIDTSVTGTVGAVSYYNGEHYLRLTDGRTVLLSNVREIVDPNAATADSGTITVTEGKATTLDYKVLADMESGTATITKDKQTIATVDLGAKKAGKYTFSWDAKDAEGLDVADGDYTVTLSGKDAKGNKVQISVSD